MVVSLDFPCHDATVFTVSVATKHKNRLQLCCKKVKKLFSGTGIVKTWMAYFSFQRHFHDPNTLAK